MLHTAHDRDRQPQLNPLLKLALEIGPLMLFFFANCARRCSCRSSPRDPDEPCDRRRAGIFVATAVFMVAILIALAVPTRSPAACPRWRWSPRSSWWCFGALTLVLQDETFIKMKPTILPAVRRRTARRARVRQAVLAIVFDAMFDLTPEGWRKLTLRWILFFLALAVLNEVVWRTQSTDFWVSFKVFAILPLTFVFAAFQYPLMTRYASAPAKDREPTAP